MQKKLIIAATSARAYAQSAHAAGYEVVALDAFADADLKLVASETYQVNMQDWQLDADDFKRQFFKINLSNVQGFCYGSLFDAAPALLNWVATQVPMIGNSAEVLKAAKAFSFFALLDRLKIEHPKVRLDFPQAPDDWLSKSLGGSGGMHVKLANQHNAGDYFQQKMMGEPVSMLFAANGKEIQVIGFNRQLTAPTLGLPYRYVGAIGGVKLPISAAQTFYNAAKALTQEMGLLGINSLDAVLSGETLSILELNPRLSASFELYPSLWNTHVQACKGALTLMPECNMSHGKMVIFADADMAIDHDIAWPDWAADLPDQEMTEGEKFKVLKDTPICSVLAEAPTAELAQVQLLQRAKQLKEMIR